MSSSSTSTTTSTSSSSSGETGNDGITPVSPAQGESKTANARDALGLLLATEHPAGYSCGGTIGAAPCAVALKSAHQKTELKFPLDAHPGQLERVKALVHQSCVGKGTETVLNLDVRKSFELLPDQVELSADLADVLDGVIAEVRDCLGIADSWKIHAAFYKMLVYEPGCFFRRHRDNERLPGTFATLVIELPSVYTGSELRVFPPSDLAQSSQYFGDPSDAEQNGGRWSCFFADDYHEVAELTSGLRSALVWTLCYDPDSAAQLEAFIPRHDQTFRTKAPPATLPYLVQPVDRTVIENIAQAVHTFSLEDDKHYPTPVGPPPEAKKQNSFTHCGEQDTDEGGKPAKLVIVLSHRYTPNSLKGIQALKGRDRVIGELVDLARKCNPNNAMSLAQIAARALVEHDPSNYQNASLIEAEMVTFHGASQEDDAIESGGAKTSSASASPQYGFQAHLAMVKFINRGGKEGMNEHAEQAILANTTTEPLVPLRTGDPPPPMFTFAIDEASLQNKRGWCEPNGSNLEAHRSLQEIVDSNVDTHAGVNLDENHGFGWGYGTDDEDMIAVYHDSVPPGTVHSDYKIFPNELLFEKVPSAPRELGSEKDSSANNKNIEFMGNGGYFMGGWYTRAAIVIWPNAHQERVRATTYGAAVELAQAAERKREREAQVSSSSSSGQAQAKKQKVTIDLS